jgi:hypothetical protein
VRIASTGSSLEADIAGIIPLISPIPAAIAVPINMFQGDRTNSKSPVKDEAIKELKAFRIAYPDYQLPADLKMLNE